MMTEGYSADHVQWEAATVRALVMDPVSSMPVVILEGKVSGRFLPIWIGLCEANAIALGLEKVDSPRPMTHDLLERVVHAASYRLDSVRIHSIKADVFHATLCLSQPNGASLEIDSRPSDAIALAVRTDALIQVSPEVFEEAAMQHGQENETVRAILEKLEPEDLGRWEM